MFISLIILLSVLCVTSAFSFIKREIRLSKGGCNLKASQIYWRWLLDEIKLSSKNAELYKIFPKDSCAVFCDLNNDGEDEIIATHYNTSKVGEGQCLLFVLQKVGDKYVKISSDVYFDVLSEIFVLNEYNGEFRNLEVKTLPDRDAKMLVFNKHKGLYVLE